jgi:hypothetical protein
MNETQPILLCADFNGLFGNLLCLSHEDTCWSANGEQVLLHEGMTVSVFDQDEGDDGKPDNLIATGTVEHSPDWLQCKGSRWVLRIDRNGVRHESDLRGESPTA